MAELTDLRQGESANTHNHNDKENPPPKRPPPASEGFPEHLRAVNQIGKRNHGLTRRLMLSHTTGSAWFVKYIIALFAEQRLGMSVKVNRGSHPQCSSAEQGGAW
jgi:hypothetical protein